MQYGNKALLIKKANLFYHDAEHLDYDKRHVEILSGEKEWWAYLGAKYIENYDSSKDEVTLLDIGSGTGFVFGAIKSHCCTRHKMFSFDFSLQMLGTARQANDQNNKLEIQYVCGDAEFLPFADNSLDIVTVNGVLHHLPDYRICLKEIDRILKRSGILIICHEPNNRFFDSPIIRIMASLYKRFGGNVIGVTGPMQLFVNNKLKESGLINENLTKDEIIELVEYNSIAEHRKLDPTRGFNAETLVSGALRQYQLLEKRYTSTFHCGSKVRLIKYIMPIIAYLARGQGTTFSLILKKNN